MPEGLVSREDGPESQQKIGQITSLNGDILSFFNVKNLKKGEAVVFDIIRTRLTLKAEIDGVKYDYQGMVPVALIPDEFEMDENQPKKWSKKFSDRWMKEWAKYSSDEEIEKKSGIKLRRSVKNHPQLY